MTELLHTREAVRNRVRQWRDERERIAFVPTMGNLHAGHFALVREAKQRAPRVVVSIFVNPLQFGANEDFARYPRTLDADLAGLKALGTDLVYAPAADELFPRGLNGLAYVDVPELADELCGQFRPGHFKGVCTVVAKLFHIVQPDCALFGEKDRQQFVLLRRMVDDLDFPIEMIGMPTVREPDGLAMSSRNHFLSASDRKRANSLYRELTAVGKSLQAGAKDWALPVAQAIETLKMQGFAVDYFECRRRVDLAVPSEHERELVVLGAARLGDVRLIDNVPVDLPSVESTDHEARI